MQSRLAFISVALALAVSSAAADVPGALEMIDGKATVSACRLIPDGRIDCAAGSRQDERVLQLPAAKIDHRARLLGLFDVDNGVREAFLGWTGPPINFVWKYEFQVFRGTRGGLGELAGVFNLDGGPEAAIHFYKPPDSRDRPKIMIDVTGGATWATSYLVSENGSSAQRMFEAAAYDYVDLNADGVYELISWDRRPADTRCHFGMFEVRVNPQIFVRSGPGYRKAWPPPDPVWTQVMALLIDVDGDRTPEIVALTDTLAEGAGAQKLAIYKLGTSSFRLLAQAPVPWPRIGYWLSSDQTAGQPQIKIWIADRSRCEEGGNPEGSGTAIARYVMEANGLKQTGIQSRH